MRQKKGIVYQCLLFFSSDKHIKKETCRLQCIWSVHLSKTYSSFVELKLLGWGGLTIKTRNLNLLALKLLTKKATTTSKRLKRLTYMPITKKTKWSSNKQRSSNTSLPQKQTISHVLNPCCIGCGIIKSDGVSNLFAQLVVAFLRYTFFLL